MRTPRLTLLVATAFVLAACGGGDTGSEGDGDAAAAGDASGEVAGEITVLTNRTDIVDTDFQDYADTFNETYPDVTVNFEALTDYEGEVNIRMNTADYGDVLLIPDRVSLDDLPNFFEPLGTVAEMEDTYRFINEKAVDGTVYGLATFGNADGFVVNKAVWEEAGVTEVPTSSEEFLAGLQAIKDNTDAIPLYTNYADGWPLAWFGAVGSVNADPDVLNELPKDPAPWTDGKEMYVLDSLLYDAVEQGLTEENPVTTNWEQSKGLMGTGEIGAMHLGSWAITQIQAEADNPDDIALYPVPAQPDGAFHPVSAGDWKIAINKNSPNKAAARAWLDFFVEETGFAETQGAIPTLTDTEMPETLAGYEELGVEYLEYNAVPADSAGLLNEVDSESEVGINEPNYRRRLVDAARGASGESKDEIFADLNSRWGAAVEAADGS